MRGVWFVRFVIKKITTPRDADEKTKKTKSATAEKRWRNEEMAPPLLLQLAHLLATARDAPLLLQLAHLLATARDTPLLLQLAHLLATA